MKHEELPPIHTVYIPPENSLNEEEFDRMEISISNT